MKKRMAVYRVILFIVFLSIFTLVQGKEDIKLLKPSSKGESSLMEALKERESSRSYSSKMLTAQHMSDLLWAAFGINRSSGKRTAPSYGNIQEIDIYVIMEKGVYLYNPKQHSLEFISKKDLRTVAGVQEYVHTAPVNLIYVADYRKVNDIGTEMVYADTGYISQNVFLFSASVGLATAVRANIDKGRLAREMELKDYQQIILGQTVGYPK